MLRIDHLQAEVDDKQILIGLTLSGVFGGHSDYDVAQEGLH